MSSDGYDDYDWSNGGEYDDYGEGEIQGESDGGYDDGFDSGGNEEEHDEEDGGEVEFEAEYEAAKDEVEGDRAYYDEVSDGFGAEEGQVEHEGLLEEEDGENDEEGLTDQGGSPDEQEGIDGGETGSEWDTDSAGGDIETDQEWWEAEDGEVVGDDSSGPVPLGAPSIIVRPPLQQGPTLASRISGNTGSTTREIWDLVKAILEDKTNYRKLLRSTGDKAQGSLDVMQKLLDAQDAPSRLKNRMRKAVARLCAKSSLYPQSLVLRDVQHGRDMEASGSFGDIWKGSYKGHQVCLKVPRIYRRQDISKFLESYAKEAIVWSQFSHPNLLPFYGIYHIQGERGDSPCRIGLVSPWMQNGNARDYLKAYPELPRRPLINGALAGLGYLHKLNIVHADVKGVNILISPNGSPCLADFGLSSIVDGDTLGWTSVQTTYSAVGTIRWQAPELLDDAEGDGAPRPTAASDVYSMASTMYEILTDKVPFYEFPLPITVVSKVIRGAKPTKPPVEPELELTEELWEVMWNCWSPIPGERPTVDEITKKLENIPYNGVTTRRMTQNSAPDSRDTHFLTSQSFRGGIQGRNSNISVAELDFLKEFTSSGIEAALADRVAGEVTVGSQS